MKIYSDGFFSIDPTHGFLPIQEPLNTLPETYKALQELLDQMPIKLNNGTPGLLASEGEFEKKASTLPNYLEAVKKETDPFVKAALFRAYSFVCSAYTLAPAHHAYLKTGKYGTAHASLPKVIAQPFVAVSEALGVFPWLDYHYSYSLGNYHKKDKTKGFEWENLAMAVKFSGMDDERGFIMLHVDINQYSPDLVKAAFGVSAEEANEASLTDSVVLLSNTMKKMNDRRKLMWEASRWKHYNDFRVFIMGVKGNDDIFPNGLTYEGVWKEPHAYRGQTGAQDNIIPTADIASGVIHYYPQNQLTQYLMDLREYRPKCVQEFFKELATKMNKRPLVDRLKETNNQLGMQHLMKVYEEIYLFRNGHWQFVQKYIMANTKYAKATGGTPIISWIPNQITAVLNYMSDVLELIPDNSSFLDKALFTQQLSKKISLLEKQLQLLHGDNYNAEDVFALNKKHKLNDD